ncbi:Glyoxalase/Bleomycin resistance protein/Dioxygenase superfamily protein [uncultured archaeon]|nr:Glyoxalase/Bleomycin resistance protein/Dioxygenase superfamily protein [uncultured archaeon]
MGLLYSSIRVKDVKKSLNFYVKYLGMKEIDRKSYMPGETVITLVSKDTKQQMRMMHYTKSCKLYSPWKENGVELDHLSFKVPDAKKAYNFLVKKGAPIASPLFENENVTLGYVKDPNGIWVGLVTYRNKK